MKKLYTVFQKIYATMIAISFFGGLVPLIPFVVALCIGGSTGETIATFLYNDVYPWIIAIGSIAILFGLVCMYLDSILKKREEKEKAEENTEENTEENA